MLIFYFLCIFVTTKYPFLLIFSFKSSKDDDQPPNEHKKEPKTFKEDSDFLNINQKFSSP